MLIWICKLSLLVSCLIIIGKLDIPILKACSNVNIQKFCCLKFKSTLKRSSNLRWYQTSSQAPNKIMRLFVQCKIGYLHKLFVYYQWICLPNIRYIENNISYALLNPQAIFRVFSCFKTKIISVFDFNKTIIRVSPIFTLLLLLCFRTWDN